MLNKTFIILKEQTRTNPGTALNCVLNMGKGVYNTDEIDLVILNTAHLPLLMNILRNKKVIVDKEPFARQIFESLTMREVSRRLDSLRSQTR